MPDYYCIFYIIAMVIFVKLAGKKRFHLSLRMLVCGAEYSTVYKE